ncbi:hypothetical protein BC941DRAFT_445178, partial [Chlamydoabsidia padenii]
HGYTPCQVMIDSSDAEIAGIKTAFGDDTKIVICQWHILKPGVKVIVRGSTAPTATEHKAYQACREFEECNGVADDVWDGSALVVYFNREYLGKKDKWSLAWREVSP